MNTIEEFPIDEAIEEFPIEEFPVEGSVDAMAATIHAAGPPGSPERAKAANKARQGFKDVGIVGGIGDYVSSLKDTVDKAVQRGFASSESTDALQARNASMVAANQKLIQDIPPTAETTAVTESKGVGDTLKAFFKDPITIGAETSAESLSALVPQMLGTLPARIGVGAGAGAAGGAALGGVGALPGAVIGGTAGMVEGMGRVSYDLEMNGRILNYLAADYGVDTSDPVALQAAFDNPDIMDVVIARAQPGALATATFDAASAAVGGRMITQPSKSLAGKIVQGAAEVGTQGALGGAGSIAGSVASGEQIQPGDVLLEVVGEAFGPEIATGAASQIGQRAASKAQNLPKIEEFPVNEPEQAKVTPMQPSAPVTPTTQSQANAAQPLAKEVDQALKANAPKEQPYTAEQALNDLGSVIADIKAKLQQNQIAPTEEVKSDSTTTGAGAAESPAPSISQAATVPSEPIAPGTTPATVTPSAPVTPTADAEQAGVSQSTTESESVIQDAINIIVREQKASVSLLQRRLRLGYSQAARIMDELEKRGVVGPTRGVEPREILISSNQPQQENQDGRTRINGGVQGQLQPASTPGQVVQGIPGGSNQPAQQSGGQAGQEARAQEPGNGDNEVVGQHPSVSVAAFVKDRLSSGTPFTFQELFSESDKAYGGTQGEGKYTVKDAYDAMELGINQFIAERGNFSVSANPDQAKQNVASLKGLIENVPTQTKRTAEQDEFQQFSTPPPFAYVVNWVSNLTPKDVVVEPSAGIGGIAVFAKTAGAKVVVNELSPRRRAILEQLSFDRVFGENAEQLNNVLPSDVKPTVVLMNPPFSATAGRMAGQRKTSFGAQHIEQALKRLQPGGRLVAIVGEGMAFDRPAFKAWWNKIRKEYNVRANVGLSGGEYRKYGTTFDNQILVIDKTGPTSTDPVSGKVDTTEGLIDILNGVRNERKPINQASTEQALDRASEASGPNPSTGPTASLPVNDVGARERGVGSQSEIPKQPSVGSERGVSKQRPVQAVQVPDTDRQPGGQRPERVPEGNGPTISSEPASGRTEQQVGGDSAGLPQPGSDSVTFEQSKKNESKSLTDSVYDDYQPSLTVKGAVSHPTALSESAAMGAVPFPPVGYKPSIPAKTIKDGALSDAQLEPIILAGEAHNQTLEDEDQSRRGFFIGDGTGVGKGREIAGIILDNFNKGRKKAIWISEKTGLAKDARRDMSGVGLDPDSLIELSKIKAGGKVEGSKGVLFLTYDTLKGGEKVEPGKARKSRVDQVIEWVGEDFDGVIAFDESHNMGNAIEIKGKRGKTKPANKALAGVDLQKRLPKARVVYVSATGATEVQNLSYASRLGLWGAGTPFASVRNFIDQIGGAGIAAMEKVAADMKAMGLYIARNLNFKGVEYDRLEHPLTVEQERIYNELAKAWQVVLKDINAALEMTGGSENRNAKSSAMSAFWGGHQRFFNQVITAMKMPTLIKSIEGDIAAGRAAVLQLVNTQEAMAERAIAQSQAEGGDLDDFDMTPRQQLLQLVERSFPVTQFETYTDENGNELSRVAVDSSGNPVQNSEAVAMRDALLDRLGSVRVPDGPLEMLLNHFGPDKVSEVTGRGRRVIKGSDGKRIVERRGRSAMESDADAFMADRKRILVFSQAGGTGRSYHADLKAKNQRPRVHYLVQPGWRADAAVQGFGRTHRSNQKQPPKYVLLTTNLPGEKRFISSIARRLDQLGALTKGSRKTGGQGFFQMRDNLESSYASDALDIFIRDLQAGRIPGLSMVEFESQTGLRLTDERGQLVGEINITKFLNRMLSLDIPTMNRVFESYSERMDALIQNAIENGTLDQGLENLTAQKTEKAAEQVVYTEPKTKAQTKHVELKLTHLTNLRTWSQAKNLASSKKFLGFVKNIRSGKVWAVSEASTSTSKTGEVEQNYRLVGTRGINTYEKSELTPDKFEKISEQQAESLWNEEYTKAPKTYTERVDLIAGVILPIWDRLPHGRHRLVRVQTENGERIIGRVIPQEELDATLQNLGAEASGISVNPRDAFANVRDANFRLTLANGWIIRRARVSGEDRVELIGPEYLDTAELQRAGVFTERIQWKTRFFIPTTDEGATTLEQITKSKPIVQSQAPTSSTDRIAEALDKAVEATDPLSGNVMEGVTGLPIWMTKSLLNGALRVARAAYRAGKSIAESVSDAVSWMKQQNPKGFDEVEAADFMSAEVERRIQARKAASKKSAETRRAKQMPEAADVANKSWRKRAKNAPSAKAPYVHGPLARAALSVVRGTALPKEFKEAREWGLAFQKYIEERLKMLAMDTRKALYREYQGPAREAAERRLMDYWTGEIELGTLTDSPALQRSAEAFRQTLDDLTQVAIDNGLVPEQLSETWLNNKGAWLKRTYLAFDPTSDWNYDTLKRRKSKGDAEIARIWNGIESMIQKQNPQATSADIEAAMRRLIDRREVEDALGLSSQPMAGSGKRFAVDTGSLIRRKALPIEVREWMGEIKDPFARGLQSSKWMAQFITRNLTQRKFARLGVEMGVLSTKPESRNWVELYPNINHLVPKKDEEGNTVMTEDGEIIAEWRQKVDQRHEPLHGFYTSPEFAEALLEFDSRVGALVKITGKALAGRAYLKGVGYIKAAKVGLSPYSYMLNTLGGIAIRIGAGALNPIRFKTAVGVVWQADKPLDETATAEQMQNRVKYLMAVKAGVTGQGVLLGDVRTNLQRESQPEPLKRAVAAVKAILGDPKGGGAWVRLRDALSDIMQLPGNIGIRLFDDVCRVDAFLHELEVAKEAFPSLPEQKQVEWAADRASNIYQTYDRLSPLLRDFSQIGVLGTFVSFKLEMFRNAAWIATYAVQGMKSNNPVLRRDGAKKAVGLTAMALAPYITATLSRKATDSDDDEVEAFQRWFVPPWDRGEELVILENSGTKKRYVPMGYMLPHYELTRAINIGVKAAQDPNPEIAFSKAMGGLLSDYFGPGAFVGPLGEAVFNKRLSGGPITMAEGARGALDRVNYLRSAWSPNIVDPLFQSWMAAMDRKGTYGREYDLAEVALKLGGIRARTVDVEKNLPFTMREFSGRWRNAATYANVAKRKYPADKAKQDEADAYRESVQDELKKQYRQFYLDAQKLGVSQTSFMKAEKEALISRELRVAARTNDKSNAR